MRINPYFVEVIMTTDILKIIVLFINIIQPKELFSHKKNKPIFFVDQSFLIRDKQ